MAVLCQTAGRTARRHSVALLRLYCPSTTCFRVCSCAFQAASSATGHSRSGTRERHASGRPAHAHTGFRPALVSGRASPFRGPIRDFLTAPVDGVHSARSPALEPRRGVLSSSAGLDPDPKRAGAGRALADTGRRGVVCNAVGDVAKRSKAGVCKTPIRRFESARRLQPSIA